MNELIWLDEELWFPHPKQALTDPDGLLAVGGDLSPERIVLAYSKGIFPWFEEGQPILWWSPSYRCLIDLNHLHVSRSLKKHLRRQQYEVKVDCQFEQVIQHCAGRRSYSNGTWITPRMIAAYSQLHKAGVAHSIEVYSGDLLVGGLYGLALGRCFFGESMFSTQTNASKTAFVHLVRALTDWGYRLIDCQLENPHLMSLGCYTVPRKQFLSILEQEAANKLPHPVWLSGKRLHFDW